MLKLMHDSYKICDTRIEVEKKTKISDTFLRNVSFCSRFSRKANVDYQMKVQELS